ncbi:unnamed protein product, partial [Brenthis ino]
MRGKAVRQDVTSLSSNEVCGSRLTFGARLWPDMEPRAVKMEWEKRRECGAALCVARHCAETRGVGKTVGVGREVSFCPRYDAGLRL